MRINLASVRNPIDGSDIVKCKLFRCLYEQVYGYPYHTHMWHTVSPGSTSYVMKPVEFNLSEMASKLRQQDWSVYYWRERDGLDDVDDDNSHINYGRREGLIFGQYCPNLTAWLLTNT